MDRLNSETKQDYWLNHTKKNFHLIWADCIVNEHDSSNVYNFQIFMNSMEIEIDFSFKTKKRARVAEETNARMAIREQMFM